MAESPKPKGGRPPLPPDQRLSEPFSIRLTKPQADALYRYAVTHGEPIDAVLRRVLVRVLERRQLL